MNFLRSVSKLQSYKTHLALLLSLLTAIATSSCGGGSSPSDTSSSNPAPSTISPGAYICYASDSNCQPTNNGNDWVGIVLPALNGMNRFFGLHYFYSNAPTPRLDPDIYSGTGTISGQSVAQIDSIYLFKDYTSGSSITDSKSLLSSLSADSLTANFNFVDPSNVNRKRVDIRNARSPVGYSSNTTASLSSVAYTWTGRLSYGGASSPDFQLSIGPDGVVTSYGPFQSACHLIDGRINAIENNLYTFSVKIQRNTACIGFIDTSSNTDLTLNGAAFTHTSPDPGKTRLYLVATTPDGRGISFKADR